MIRDETLRKLHYQEVIMMAHFDSSIVKGGENFTTVTLQDSCLEWKTQYSKFQSIKIIGTILKTIRRFKWRS